MEQQWSTQNMQHFRNDQIYMKVDYTKYNVVINTVYTLGQYETRKQISRQINFDYLISKI